MRCGSDSDLNLCCANHVTTHGAAAKTHAYIRSTGGGDRKDILTPGERRVGRGCIAEPALRSRGCIAEAQSPIATVPAAQAQSFRRPATRWASLGGVGRRSEPQTEGGGRGKTPRRGLLRCPRLSRLLARHLGGRRRRRPRGPSEARGMVVGRRMATHRSEAMTPR